MGLIDDAPFHQGDLQISNLFVEDIGNGLLWRLLGRQASKDFINSTKVLVDLLLELAQQAAN